MILVALSLELIPIKKKVKDQQFCMSVFVAYLSQLGAPAQL